MAKAMPSIDANLRKQLILNEAVRAVVFLRDLL